jgi:phage terminase large subunit-like protein
MAPHIKGPLRGQLIKLEPWQCFILTTVFGWVSKHTGARRFRESYTEVPRGNGKSALTSPVGLYLMSLDGEGGAEIYSAATTRDQARIVFGVAQAMAQGMGDFCRRAGIDVGAHSINQLTSASWFRPLSSDANSLDGLNVHGGLIDELHAHKSRELYDVLKTACGKRSQPLLWEITTAGSDRAGICYEVRGYVLDILKGVKQDDRVFGIVYTIDDEDDWADLDSAIKANPNWGVSVFPDAIAADLHQAVQLASKQPSYQTKHLDRWVNADHIWMDMLRLAKCADPSLHEADFTGQPCSIGLDLASKLDLLAKVKIFWKDMPAKERSLTTEAATVISELVGAKKTERHYYVFGKYWTPEARLELTQNSQYRGWALEGRLQTCPGETNDYDLVEDDIRQDCRTFQVLEVAHDPFQAHSLVNHLQPEGVVMVEVPQLPKYLSEPMKELEAAVYDGRFHFDGDPVLVWAISNVVCHPDKNDNLFPNKERFENKIDPVTALLTGLNRVMAATGMGGGITVVRPCQVCQELCLGQTVKGEIVFDCGRHGNA